MNGFSHISVNLIRDEELCNDWEEYYIGDYVLLSDIKTNLPVFFGLISYIGKFSPEELIVDNSKFNKINLDLVSYMKYPVAQIVLLHDFEAIEKPGSKFSPMFITDDLTKNVFNIKLDISLFYNTQYYTIKKVNVEAIVYV